jgi:hypothetical protein
VLVVTGATVVVTVSTVVVVPRMLLVEVVAAVLDVGATVTVVEGRLVVAELPGPQATKASMQPMAGKARARLAWVRRAVGVLTVAG